MILNGEHRVFMARVRSFASFFPLHWALCVAGASALAGCSGVPHGNPFALGEVDANSSVAAQVREASQAPGPYPRLDRIPPNPTDVRPASAWKVAVTSEWTEKKQVEAEAAAIPFTLKNTDAFAQTAHSRIQTQLATQAPADAEAQARDFAEAQRARAMPPPKPN